MWSSYHPRDLHSCKPYRAQDPVLMTLLTAVITRCPELGGQIPILIRDYWLCHDKMSLHNGALLRNHRLIVPRLLREEFMLRIHSSHLGIESYLRKASNVFFWPGINSQIKEIVSNCHVCTEYQAHNPRQPLQIKNSWKTLEQSLSWSFHCLW